MTKVTRIIIQQKNKHRFNVFIDDGQGETYGFSVDEDVLIETGLKKGMELDSSTIALLIQKDNLQKAYSLALNYLSYRMRSKKEIVDYLMKKEVDSEQIQHIIDRLVQEKLLNDKEFAIALVNTRMHTSSKGPMLLKKELIEKGISPAVIDEALATFTYEMQYEKAAKWVTKKLSVTSKKSFKQQIQNLQQTLIQKGFTNDVIRDVLAEAQEEKSTDTEKMAVAFQGEKLWRKYSTKAQGAELKQKVKGGLYRKGFDISLIDEFIEEQSNEG
ncbi:recombination regulator RecX [Aquibacillus kalidii]|uniref:recombination regulator RecX n=1 Tax=Aquibacillus kalidii TaxID=2762597 RepID=UPI00164890BB|nr:recombination regulator RecX [Aquibacillus kalidii]